MSEGKRPGGLTALAVINFVFAGLGVIGILGMVTLFALKGKIPTEAMDAAQRRQIEAFQDMGTPMLVGMTGLSAVSTILLIAAGVGYLQQKKLLGRTLGNAYGLVAIIYSVGTATMFPSDLGGGFQLATIIGLIYPVITLALINTTFKDDLTN